MGKGPDGRLNVLLVTKGHPFDRNAFFDVFDANEGIEYTHVEQPAAQMFFTPELAAPYDCFVLYDMPGIRFRPGADPELEAPPQRLREGLAALTAEGLGFVFLHHALAGWPAWPGYGEILGGRFLYLPGDVRGRACLDSGYRHDVTHRVTVVQPDHPVTRGLPQRFTMTDELYLAEVFEDDVEPLLVSDFDFRREEFHSALHAVRGRMFCNEDWDHPPGSALVGWTRREDRSRIVYLQAGDAPSAHADPNFRRLVANAIEWTAAGTAEAGASSRTGTG